MVQPATPHIDNSLGASALEISHFAQWSASSPPPPQSSQFGNPMMFNSPMEMPPFGVTPILAPVAPTASNAPEVLGPPGAAVFPHYSPEQSVLMSSATSHSVSSPTSCSE
uniref:Uncharacterized protein n=2 Tax=Caenorhabditis japonica TaxID=281687 RepID=A0A8R1IZD3_CAEJA